MNRHQRRLEWAKYPKQDIVFMRVNFDTLDQAPQVVKLLHANYKALNYPFGYGRVKYHTAEKNADGYGYFIVATVHLNHMDYMRKCALSGSDTLQNVCASWVQAYYPEQASDYMQMLKFYRNQRHNQMLRSME